MTLPPRPLDPRGKGLNYVLGECKVIVEFIIVKEWENLKLVTHFNSLEMYNSIYSFFKNSNVYKTNILCFKFFYTILDFLLIHTTSIQRKEKHIAKNMIR